MPNNFSPLFKTLWSFTDEAWSKDDWRVVGTRKRSLSVIESLNRKDLVADPIFGEAFYLTTAKKFENMNINEIIVQLGDTTLYLVEFGSGRLDIAYTGDDINGEINNFVIIEADRGEDCGMIVGITTKYKYRTLLSKLSEVPKEVQPKRIFRKATKRDLETLKLKEQSETEALMSCRKRVREKTLEMEVLGCEYQWDKHKLTFFFISEKRIDFRELVKELYKIYKTRIWMCAVEKSKNLYLRELLPKV